MGAVVEKGLKRIGITVSKPILAIICIVFGRSLRDCSWERYFWSICHDRFVLYITWVLVRGFLQKFSISAVISRFVLFAIDISTRVSSFLIMGEYKVSLINDLIY